MIKKLLFVAALTTATAAGAQTNLGFETWSTTQFGYEDPNGWGTLNILSLLGGSISAEKSTDAHQGTYSCQLTTTVADLGDGDQTIPGIVALSADGNTLGVPYTSRPDSIIFWYKYVPQGSDNAGATVSLMQNSNEIGYAEVTLNAQSAWTRGGMKIVYSGQETPDTLSITFASSTETPVEGSVMKVDAVEIKMGSTVGIKDVVAGSEILMYPNPAKTELYVRLEKEATIEIYNVLGSKIETLKSNGTDKTVIPVSEYANGVYILKTNTGISQRFVVKH